MLKPSFLDPLTYSPFVRYLTFDRPRKFRNRMHLCLYVNKRQRKCHVNCVGDMPEEKVTIRCVGVQKNN